ncbi:branched-chain amino acid ABC transporter permease [Celeribacter neptunius]|uniref:Branched-chain amino acid transport system permease protein n=1 Tax=Celeribacter neptunius TaxID=588602 RepID=A0A1I3UCW7_9RHOB|nr:branched-chain amino acid ABC transporter permease [Celeribacter neptunius]SFJ80840.1 branched-chain amino acid transport system permease protein [Celeribacter neptunius]
MNIVEILISGTTQGAVYCVIAMGLSLVYGTSRILNFAHGALYTLGGYIAWYLMYGGPGLSFGLAFLATLPILFGVGVVLEAGLIRPLRRHPNWQINAIMVTLGLAFVIENGLQLLFGPKTKTIPAFIEGGISIAGTTVSLYKIALVFMSILLVVLLELFLARTRAGKSIQAVSQDLQGAAQVGINVNRVFGLALGLSVVLTGAAGILLAPIFQISPIGGWSPFLKAFVIVVFGGLGSTRGAMLAAFILAFLEAVVVATVGPGWSMPAWLIVLMVVLMIRPKGLLGVWEN